MLLGNDIRMLVRSSELIVLDRKVDEVRPDEAALFCASGFSNPVIYISKFM